MLDFYQSQICKNSRLVKCLRQTWTKIPKHQCLASLICNIILHYRRNGGSLLCILSSEKKVADQWFNRCSFWLNICSFKLLIQENLPLNSVLYYNKRRSLNKIIIIIITLFIRGKLRDHPQLTETLIDIWTVFWHFRALTINVLKKIASRLTTNEY